MDERRKKKLEETSIAVLGLFYVVCTLEMVIKLIVTHEFSSILGELIILLSITFTFLIARRFDKHYSPALPRKNNGEELSAEKTTKAKLKRIFIYAKESIIFSIALVVVDIAFNFFIKENNITFDLNFFISQLAKIIITFIPFFIIDTVLKERSIKKYNKWNEKLDE